MVIKYVTSRAKCIQTNCRRYKLIIEAEPRFGEDVMRCLMDKTEINHDGPMKTAGIRKEKRKEIGSKLKITSISFFEEMAANTAEDELAAGYKINVPSPTVLRKIKQETKHYPTEGNSILELLHLGEYIKIEASGADAEGYIGEIISDPPEKLIDHLYSMLQVSLFRTFQKARYISSPEWNWVLSENQKNLNQ